MSKKTPGDFSKTASDEPQKPTTAEDSSNIETVDWPEGQEVVDDTEESTSNQEEDVVTIDATMTEVPEEDSSITSTSTVPTPPTKTSEKEYKEPTSKYFKFFMLSK